MGTLGELVTGGGSTALAITERFTEAARKAIFDARSEALRRHDTVITVADLLAGLSFEEGTRAERVGCLKENAFYLRWLSGLPALPAANAGGESPDEASHAEMDSEARRALAYAVAEADRDREYWIDTDHLLRGLLRFQNKAHFAVLKTEINLNSARTASRLDREEFLPQETPNLKVIQYLIRKHFAIWGPSILSLACYLYILIQGFGMELSPLAK